MNKKRFLGLSVLLVVFLILSVLALGGCDTTTPPDDDDDDNGVPDVPDVPDPDPEPAEKVLTVGMSSFPEEFDPHATRHTPSQAINDNIVEALAQLDPLGNRILGIAKSVEDIDQTTSIIYLREDVKFHNGEPMTADDVIFSFTRQYTEGGMEGANSPNYRPPGNSIESMEKIDDFTIKVVFTHPNMLRFLGWEVARIIPKGYFEEVGPEGFGNHPKGAGPFKWVEGDAQNYVVLERFEDYYGGVPEAHLGQPDRVPAVDRLIYRFIPETSTRIAALLAGEVDYILDVPTDYLELLIADPKIQVAGAEGTIIHAIEFNVKKEPWDNKLVRQAVAYAIDYDTLIDSLYSGYSTPLYGRPYLVPYTGMPGLEANAIDHLLFEYNPEKARELLAEAGYGDGTPPAVFDTVALHSDQVLAIAQMLGEVGINVSVRTWEGTTLNAEWWAENHQRDIRLTPLGQGGRSPQGIHNRVGTGKHWNFSQYSNPTFEGLWEAILAMEEHTAEREELIIQAYEIIMDEVPTIWMHHPDVLVAARSHVKNFSAQAQMRPLFSHVDIE